MKFSELIKKSWTDWLLILFALIALVLNILSKNPIIESLLFLVSATGSIQVVISAFKSLLKKKISVDLLASVALLVSLLNGEWVSAAFINLMLASARILALYTDARATNAINSLLKFRPEKVRVSRNGTVEMIKIEDVRLEDTVIINPGELVPIDGTVTKGQTTVDQSSLTGESLPSEKEVGSQVFSSTMNISGLIKVKTEKIGKDTTLEKIIALIEKSQKGKAKIYTLGEKFSTIYIFLSIVVSVLLYLLTGRLELVLSVLLVVCADDIAVAVPLAFLASIGRAARQGVIVKGGNYLEQIAKAKVIFLDKTGTITKGKLVVDGIFSEIPKNEFQDILSNIAYFSSHPVSKAISEYLTKENKKIPDMPKLEEFAGRGVAVEIDNEKIFYGKKRFLEEQKIVLPKEVKEKIICEENNGQATVIVASQNKFYGFVSLSDEIRPEVKESIIKLKELGIEKIVMLTGDNEASAKKVASAIMLDDFKANLMPEDKVKYLENSQYRGKGLIMIGDGVNDSASLALADVGIAMGKIGSDSAIESSDITLMRDDFREIPKIIELAKETMKVSRQDFYIWGFSNIVGLTLVFMGFIGPIGASAYNFLTDFLPLGNSLKLFRYNPKSNF